MSNKVFDIIIVGGGLSGIITAIALSKLNLKVALIAKDLFAHKLAVDPRTSAIAVESTRILDEFGVWQDLKQYAGEIHQIRVTDNLSPLYLHFDGNDINSLPLGYMLDNSTITEVFKKHLSNKITIIDSHISEIITNDNYKCSLKLENHDIVSASLVIASDGKYSKLRSLAGIASTEKNYNETAIVCLARHEIPHDNIAQEMFYPSGPFAVLPMKDKHISGIVWTESNETAQALIACSKEDRLGFMMTKLTDYLGHVDIISECYAYPLSLVYTNEYYKNRILLIGDSLHGIHPISGQGYNLTLRDVHVLYKLVQETIGLGLDFGSKIMLNKFKEQRYYDNLAMIKITDGFDSLFSNHSSFLAQIRRLGLSIVNHIPLAKNFFMKYASGKRL